MSPTAKLYTVSLQAHGTYKADIIADTPEDAAAIAENVLLEDAFNPVPGFSIVKRVVDAEPSIAPIQPTHLHEVTVEWVSQYTVTIPSDDQATAITAVQRMTDQHQGPVEFDVTDSRLHQIRAREVIA